jgi:nitrogen regulatory protein P-II 1
LSVQGFKLVAAIVPKGAAGKVMDAAKEAGAEGGTILLARGTGVHEARRFFGISMSTERELLLILIDPERAQEVMDSMVRAGRLDEPGRGMAFVLSVDEGKGSGHREPSEEA